MRERQIYGFLGPTCPCGMREEWNRSFTERGLNAFFDFYRTRNRHDLELRLSEMFLHERAGYILDPSLQELAFDLMDRWDEETLRLKKVAIVKNEGGIFIGSQCSFYHH